MDRLKILSGENGIAFSRADLHKLSRKEEATGVSLINHLIPRIAYSTLRTRLRKNNNLAACRYFNTVNAHSRIFRAFDGACHI
jgi:hypothetical protein